MAINLHKKMRSAIDSTLADANRFAVWLTLIVAITLMIEFVCGVLFYGIDSYTDVEIVCSFVPMIVLLGAFFLGRYCMKNGKHDPVRYFVIGSLIIAASTIHLSYGPTTWLLLTIPIFVTTIYYNPRFTILTGILVYLLNIGVSAAALYVPPYFFYSTTYPIDGTVLVLSGDTSLANQIGTAALGMVDWINYSESLHSTILYNVIDGFFAYGAVTAICVAAAQLTNRAVEKEHELASEQERVSLEFSATSEMQKQMLTDIPRVFRKQDNIDIWAIMDPAREVGGDFYVAQQVGDRKVGFLVADVSGKGMAAALFGSNARALCSWPSYAAKKSPAELLTIANKGLCSDNESMMFVTLWMGELDLDTGLLKYCNAGHNPPLIRRVSDADAGYTYLTEKSGPVLGVVPGYEYKDFEIQLEPGDTLLLYTDGVTECKNASKEEYGEKRLEALLDAQQSLSCHELIDTVRDDVRKFANGEEQFDDITLLAVKLNHLREAEEPVQIESQTRFFAAIDENLDDMKDFLRTELARVELDSTVIEVITACIEELFVNVNHYAYDKSGGAQCISIWSEPSEKYPDDKNRRRLHVALMDSGTPFNPLEDAEAPNLGPAEQRPIGGLGIFMVRQVMDEVTYSYESNCNIVNLSKEI